VISGVWKFIDALLQKSAYCEIGLHLVASMPRPYLYSHMDAVKEVSALHTVLLGVTVIDITL
jgi:hypothetical protein